MKETIIKENKAVVINSKDGYVWACLYVNARQWIEKADITNLKWEGKSVVAAKKWAAKQLK